MAITSVGGFSGYDLYAELNARSARSGSGRVPGEGDKTSSVAPPSPGTNGSREGEKSPGLSDAKKTDSNGQQTRDGELSAEDKATIASLRSRDNEVRQHEAAHVAAGGRYVRGGANFSYETGPDSKRYAVGGEVSIDSSAEDDPAATIQKMQVVRRAAMAPAKPSGQDMKVAASASQKEINARMELAKEVADEASGAGEDEVVEAEQQDSIGVKEEEAVELELPGSKKNEEDDTFATPVHTTGTVSKQAGLSYQKSVDIIDANNSKGPVIIDLYA